jgi:hypothetical protein
VLRKAFRLGRNEELYEGVGVSEYYERILSNIMRMLGRGEMLTEF